MFISDRHIHINVIVNHDNKKYPRSHDCNLYATKIMESVDIPGAYILL